MAAIAAPSESTTFLGAVNDIGVQTDAPQATASFDDEQTQGQLADDGISLASIADSDLTAAQRTHVIPGLQPVGAKVNVFDYTVIAGAANDHFSGTLDNWINSGINANHRLLFGSGLNSNNGERLGWWNVWSRESDSRPTQYIVANRLGADGYPQLSKSVMEGNATSLAGRSNSSLAYLFDSQEIANAKTVRNDAQGLFQLDQATGNYYFDSRQNFAELVNEGGQNRFLLWDEPAVQADNNSGKVGFFFPFDSASKLFNYDAATGALTPTATRVDSNGMDHYFGMEATVPFRQPDRGYVSKDNPMTFTFEGDDDVWVFIDGVLVADLGGTHARLKLDINFEDGQVNTYNEDGSVYNNHTLRSSFVEALGEDAITGRFKEGTNTFVANSPHELKMFFLERGGYSSNLTLSFNLQPQLYQQIRKVDEDGNPVADAVFDLYQADEKYNVAAGAAPLVTLTTDARGYAYFTDGTSQADPFGFSSRNWPYYVLRERTAPTGYKSLPTDIHLNYMDSNTMLRVENRYETGAFASFNSYVTGITGETHYGELSSGGGLATPIEGLPALSEYQQRNGLLVAVPMIRHGQGTSATWNPLYGDNLDTLSEIEYATGDLGSAETRQAARGAALEAALRQAAGGEELEDWYLEWNDEEGRYNGTLESLPGSPNRYLNEHPDDPENADMRMMYCFIEPEALQKVLGKTPAELEAMTNAQKYDELGTLMQQAIARNSVQDLLDRIDYQGNMPADRGFSVLSIGTFSRTFRSVVYIPNEQRELRVWKVDNAGNRVDGAVFALFETEAEANSAVDAVVATDANGSQVVQGITDSAGGTVNYLGAGVTGTPRLSADQSSSNADDQPGTLIFAPYVLNGTGTAHTSWIESDGSDPTGKMLYLKEVKAPEGHAKNPTVIPVVIGRYGIYADAGEANDGVMALAGVGKLNATMRKYAASPNVNLTLRYITATAQVQPSRGDTLGDFDAFNRAWGKDGRGRSLNLEYGANALVDYGSPTVISTEQINNGVGYTDAFGHIRPLLCADVGYIRTQVTQNTTQMNQMLAPGAAYAGSAADNLASQDITSLFMIRNIVRVEDPIVPELVLTNRVVTEEGIVAPNETFSFTVSAPGKSDGTVNARVLAWVNAGSAEVPSYRWEPTGETVPVEFSGGKATVSLADGEGVSIPGMPENVSATTQQSTTLGSGAKLMEPAAWNAGKTAGFALKSSDVNGGTGSVSLSQSATVNNDNATTITWGSGENAQSYAATAFNYVNQYRPVQQYVPRVNITKTMVSRPFRATDSFSFELVAAPFDNPNGDVPMPAGAVNGSYVKTWKPTADDIAQAGTEVDGKMQYSATFPIISGTQEGSDPNDVVIFTKPGTYTYLVSEVRPSQGHSIAGITYDPSVYAITLTATPLADPNGATVGFDIYPTEVKKRAAEGSEYATIWTGDKDGAETAYRLTNFENSYNENVVDPVIRGYKLLSGHEGGAGDFDFALTAQGAYAIPDQATKDLIGDGTPQTPQQLMTTLGSFPYDDDFKAENSLAGKQPMPGGGTPSASATVQASVDEKGNIQFAPLTFDKDSLGFADDDKSKLGVVFKYQVHEVQPTDDGTFAGTPKAGAVKVDTNGDGIADSWKYQGTVYDPSVRTMYYYAHVDPALDDDNNPTGGTAIHVLRYGQTPFTGVLEDGTAAPGQPFSNSYSAHGSLAFEGEKILSGRDFVSNDQFQFVVTRSDGAPPLLDADGNPVTQVTIRPESGESYRFAIGTAAFTQEDIGKEYTYSFQEVNGGRLGMVYDMPLRVVKVTVADGGDGTLAVSAQLSTGGEPAVPLTAPVRLAWNNTYDDSLLFPCDLAVHKVVRADDGAHNGDVFHFSLLITEPDGTPLSGTYVMRSAQTTQVVGQVTNGFAEFTLGGGQGIVVQGLPQGAHFEVVEDEANVGCVTTVRTQGDGGANVLAGVGSTVTVTNDFSSAASGKPGEGDDGSGGSQGGNGSGGDGVGGPSKLLPNTGDSSPVLPLALAMAVAAAVALFSRFQLRKVGASRR